MTPIRFEMRLDQEVLDQVEEWRDEQPDVPSRAEAVRRLLGIGLNKSGAQGAKVSDGEKLILMMFRDLFRHHKVSGDTDPEFIQKVLLGGHYWALDWEMPGLIHDHVDSISVVTEVVNVLEMWFFIETGFAKFSTEQKERVKSEAQFSGDNVTFLGFDGNTESNHGNITRFLVNDMGRFDIFKGRDLNSHSPSIDAYRRMLTIFEPMRPHLVGRELAVPEIILVLKAQRAGANLGKADGPRG